MRDEIILKRSLREPYLFSQLVFRYEKPFLRKAKRILGNTEDAEDVVQETFTKIYLHASRFEEVDTGGFSSWAYAILTNTALSLYRKKKLRWEKTAPLTPEEYESLGTIDKALQNVSLEDTVARALTAIPKHCARIVRLYFLEGYTHKEIAEQEGISEGASKTRLHRAKKVLRRNTQHTL